MELSLKKLPDFAREFVKMLPQEAGAEAHIVGLSGDLGAGKTTFVKEVAKALGVKETVQSPTFIFVRTHPIPNGAFKTLVHADLYRLHESDAETIGLRNYAANPDNLVFIEWPENLPAGVRESERLAFDVLGEDTRRIAHVNP
jgi:tRNA threonylcarbamoyladenosine biosynthesis protein TsaE